MSFFRCLGFLHSNGQKNIFFGLFDAICSHRLLFFAFKSMNYNGNKFMFFCPGGYTNWTQVFPSWRSIVLPQLECVFILLWNWNLENSWSEKHLTERLLLGWWRWAVVLFIYLFSFYGCVHCWTKKEKRNFHTSKIEKSCSSTSRMTVDNRVRQVCSQWWIWAGQWPLCQWLLHIFKWINSCHRRK